MVQRFFGICCLVTLLAASVPGESPAASATGKIDIATGGTGGPLQAFGAGWAKLINAKTRIQATVSISGGAIENIRLLGGKKTDLGYVDTPGLGEAFRGEGPWKADAAVYRDLRTLYTYFYGGLQLVTRADFAITRAADLKGKRISIGAPGSALTPAARAILAAHGLGEKDYSGQQMVLSAAASALKDGSLSAVFYLSPWPMASIIDIASARRIFLIPLEGDAVRKFADTHRGWFRGEIPPGTYQQQANGNVSVPTVVTTFTVAVRKDMNPEVAYEIVKVLFENLGEFYPTHAQAKEVKLPAALKGAVVPAHAGALRYYRERGVTVPDELVPPEAR